MISIAHIINPVIAEKQSDLFLAQPVTFETMRIARKLVSNQVRVSLHTAQYPEDRSLIPDFFSMTPDLTRSVMHIDTF